VSVDVSLHHDDRLVRPWRTAAFVAAAVAAVELLVLVVVGGALIAKPSTGTAARPAKVAPAKPSREKAAARVTPHRAAAPAAHLVRGKVKVLVLNGNGRQGAAASTAARVSRRGYRIGGVANAPRSDFTRSLVMYRRGFEGEGRRLARDLGIGIVGPLDGLRTAQLHGAHAVVVIGR
jgi:LytR cell envelope-related transcriptional attenuator